MRMEDSLRHRTAAGLLTGTALMITPFAADARSGIPAAFPSPGAPEASGQASTAPAPVVEAAPSATLQPVTDTHTGGPSANDDAGPADGRLGDVVVTARKRTERLQDVPVAVSAASGDALQTQGAVDVQSIARVAPGLFYQSIEPSRPNIYLRGVGTRSFDAGAESSVGTFIDGVYIGRFGGQIANLVGVERVEVLKGPQGALFGRNTIGGAINVTTKKPGNDLDGRISATYDRQSHFDADGYSVTGLVSGPLVKDRLFALVAGGYTNEDGSTLATNSGRRYNGLESASVRGRLVWRPDEAVEFDLIGDYLSTGNALGFSASSAGGRRPALLLAKPGLTAPEDADLYRITQNDLASSRGKSGGVSLTSTYSGGGVALTSITAYRAGRQRGNSDLDGTFLDLATNPVAERSSQFSQELRIGSTPGGALTFADHVNWVAGAYYYSEKVHRTEGTFIGTDNVLTLFTGGQTLNNVSDVRIRTSSYAFFGQAGIKLTEALKLDLGLRYGNDRKQATIAASSNINTPFFVPANFVITPRRNWDSLDPSATLSYKVDRDAMLYASYSKGFKSGAFQYLAFTPELAGTVVNPERLNAYQVGAKTELLRRRLRLNAAAFYYDYKDIQLPRIQIPDGGSVPVVTLSNAASSHIKGFEIEGAAVLNKNLRVEYGYAYLDATFQSYVYSPTLDFTGNRLPRSPRNTVDLAGIVTIPTALGGLEVRGAMNYVSSFYFEADNEERDAGTRESGRALFDASATLTRGSLSFTLWGRNLSDRAYRASVLNISGYRLDNVWSQRRTIGLTIAAALK